jgi:alpha-tubulin suppressor-like RCC1 family protein
MVKRLAIVLTVVFVLVPLAGYHAAGASGSGTVWAWGNNSDGELGNGSSTLYEGNPTPGQVSSLTGVIAIAAGSEHSLALTSSGTVWAWGNGGWGQLGQGVYRSSTIPIQVPGLSGITAIAAGQLHSMALGGDGTVWAWGYNIYGQVGNGASGANVLAPVKVRGLTGIVAIAAGNDSDTSYALKSDGTVWAWGYDGLGGLGNGTSNESPHPTPVRVSNLTGVTAIAAGTYHALALRSTGTVMAWGSNQYSQLGATTTGRCSSYSDPCSTVPVRSGTLSAVVKIAAGGNSSLALKSDGTVWGWGDNGYGQLANGTTTTFGGVKTPTRASLTSITAIALGGSHSVALKSDGSVWSAGYNDLGQLGNGTFTSSPRPVRAISLGTVTAVASGLNHTLAIAP